MHNCDLVNLEDMLQNGTVISGTLIERPHSFSTACNIATQIIAQVASNQYGGQSISLAHLAPFVEVSRREDPPPGRCRRSTRSGSSTSEEVISGVVETAPAGGDPPGGADHSVPGGHPHDHQRTGPLRHRVHVPGRGP
ncbi:MAG: anaerobic ribonucleoside-triphosphate reductase [Collinsella sp.]